MCKSSLLKLTHSSVVLSGTRYYTVVCIISGFSLSMVVKSFLAEVSIESNLAVTGRDFESVSPNF